MATARPSLKEGPVATQAWEKARPKDNVDTEQAVAEAVQSLVHASTLGAQRLAEGEGGEGAGTTAGAGGLTEGSKAQRLGIASRETIDFGTTDPRYLTYFRKLHARIDPLWQEAFPKAALVEGKQGTVILEFVVKNTGALEVVWPPLRPSGIDEFDRRCAEALRRAGPVDPIPPSLGTQALRIRAPFVAKNPAVH
jgi:TonB family protein